MKQGEVGLCKAGCLLYVSAVAWDYAKLLIQKLAFRSFLFQRILHNSEVNEFEKSNHKITPALNYFNFCWDVHQHLLADHSWNV